MYVGVCMYILIDVCWCMYVRFKKKIFNYISTTIVYLKSVIKHKALHHGSTCSQLACPLAFRISLLPSSNSPEKN